MADSFSPALLLGSFRTLATRMFWVVLLIGAGLFVLRELLNWPILPIELSLIWQFVAFEAGVALGFFLISAHQIWLRLILSFLPGTQEEDAVAVDTLRSPVMFLALPVVIFLLILTPPSWIGLGALWSIASWYALEAWSLLKNNIEVLPVYFPRLQSVQQDAVYHVVLWVYLVIWGGFSLMLVIR